ncbi:ketoacyl-ACP synthase III family protein [Streptomyces uncialis]|uniref:ketoacyl-ACP synthase III family protein n=2 Tax=Streptomyces uncialis TaxID=1048205 RepID=UPI00093CFC5D|nr:ketoacyl-ACP synthase III family protein [Streptomyces uncialis]WTE09740.1 ketoacyl-ACP synthase III family protein [Streptomyces uncialis]
MRTDIPLYINAAALWLPQTASTAEEAAASGVIRLRAAEAEGFAQLAVCHDRTVSSMAAEAARTALEDAGLTPDDVDLHIHCWVYEQGEGVWSPAHRVARLTGAHHCMAFGLQQQSNSGATAIETALTKIATDPRTTTALITTADKFNEVPQGRWSPLSDGGPLGDGATAVVLTPSPGPLLIESIAGHGDTSLEPDFPGRDPFGLQPPDPNGSPFRKQDVLKRMRACVKHAVDDALDDAHLSPDAPGIDSVLPCFLGQTFIDWTIRPALPTPLQDKIRRYGSHTGHLGGGDLTANLAFTLKQPPPPESHTLLVSVGAGYCATCLVVRA